jgi:hypothetical protein
MPFSSRGDGLFEFAEVAQGRQLCGVRKLHHFAGIIESY